MVKRVCRSEDASVCRAGPRALNVRALGTIWVLCVAFGNGCDSHKSHVPMTLQHETLGADGGQDMTRDELTTRLGTPSNEDREKLAEEIAASARQGPQKLVDIWLATSDSEVEFGARVVGRGLAELSISPMLDAEPPADPERRSLLLGIATEKEIALRQRLMVRLEQSLDDKALLPPPNFGSRVPERKPPKIRVCDEAYLHIWKLMHFGASYREEHDEKDRFLKQSDRDESILLPYEGRDADIQKARTSRPWRIAMGWHEDRIDEAEAAEKPPGPPPPRH